MAEWWESSPIVTPAPSNDDDWWSSSPLVEPQDPMPPLPPPSAKPAYKGSILPFSRDAQGNVEFDSDAGLLGVAKRVFNLPGEVYAGEVDPLSDQGIERAVEFASAVTPLNPALRAGERLVPGVAQNLRQATPEAPTAEELRQAARAGYDAAKDAGVDYSASSVRDMAAKARVALEGEGYFSELAPKSFKILERLENPPEGSVATIAGLDAARKSLKNARLDFTNPTERATAKQIVEALDGFIQNPPASSVLAGPASEAGAALKSARGNYAAAKRSETLTGLRGAAELRAAVANSGLNLDNATRQRLASLALSPKASAGFTAAERQAIEDVARGTPSANAMRYVGNLLGGGGGMGAAVVTGLGTAGGGYSGGVPGAIAGSILPAAVGNLSRRAAGRATRRGLLDLDEKTRIRSPLFEDRAAAAPIEPEVAASTDILARILGLLAPQTAEQRLP